MTPTNVPLPMYITLRLDLLSGLMKDIAESAHQKRDGVSVREVRLLLQISDHPGLTLSRLVELSFMEKTMVSKAITSLTRTGLVVRHVDADDARKLSLDLTRKGRAVAERARQYVQAATDNVMSALTPAQRTLFDDALGRLAEQLLLQKEQGLDLLDPPVRPKAPAQAGARAARVEPGGKGQAAGRAAARPPKPRPSPAPAVDGTEARKVAREPQAGKVPRATPVRTSKARPPN